MPRQRLRFYCFKNKKRFSTREWGVFARKVKGTQRYFAITEKNGYKCITAITKELYEQHKR